MTRERLRLPLAWRIAPVVALFVAAVGTLWYASSSVVGREERRARAIDRLQRAGDILESRGGLILAGIRPYPQYIEPEEWAAIEARLVEVTSQVRALFPDVEGGFYLPDRHEQAFVPASRGAEGPPVGPRGRQGDPPPRGRALYDDVETQADAAYRKKSPRLVVEDVPPDTVAIRAAPVLAGGKAVASAWALIPLVDPVFLDRPSVGYRVFAGLALAGIALSTALTLNLVRTVRRGAAERGRLQLEVRRNERLAALGTLLAGVAHEVRNPLAGIRSTAQLWQRGLGIGAESLEGLVQEVDRLDEIVSSLLRFSRADATGLSPGDLNAVLAEAARLVTSPARAQGVRIDVDVDLDPNLPRVAMSPPSLLQLFRNLTTNAIQAMPGGGTIRLSTRHDPERLAVRATVEDGGPGLSAEAIGHLFEPFFTTKAEGTGLGLAIAREIALAHGGDLIAANRPGVSGASFTLTLPADPIGRTGGAP